MDAVNSLLNAQQGALQTKINFAVASKALDAAELQGDAVNQLLQDAAQLSKAVGRGGQVDLQG